jgi:hypothetical protein
MNPIDPVSLPVQSATSQVKKIQDLQPASGEGPSMETLTQRFQALLAPEPENVQGSEGTNAVAKVLDTNEQLMRQNADMSSYLQANAPNMSPEEIAAATTEMVRTQSISDFRNQAVLSVASNTNKSLQGLLKNS